MLKRYNCVFRDYPIAYCLSVIAPTHEFYTYTQGLYAIVNMKNYHALRCAWEFKLLQDTVRARDNLSTLHNMSCTQARPKQSRCTLFGGTELPPFCTAENMFVIAWMPCFFWQRACCQHSVRSAFNL